MKFLLSGLFLLPLLAHAQIGEVLVKDFSADCVDGGYVKLDGSYLCRLPLVRATLVNGTKSTNYIALLSHENLGSSSDSLDGFCAALGFSHASNSNRDTINYSKVLETHKLEVNSIASMKKDGSFYSLDYVNLQATNPYFTVDVTCR